jgi:hypothetical protein
MCASCWPITRGSATCRAATTSAAGWREVERNGFLIAYDPPEHTRLRTAHRRVHRDQNAQTRAAGGRCGGPVTGCHGRPGRRRHSSPAAPPSPTSYGISASCRCRNCFHIMRPADIRGSARRGDHLDADQKPQIVHPLAQLRSRMSKMPGVRACASCRPDGSRTGQAQTSSGSTVGSKLGANICAERPELH